MSYFTFDLGGDEPYIGYDDHERELPEQCFNFDINEYKVTVSAHLCHDKRTGRYYVDWKITDYGTDNDDMHEAIDLGVENQSAFMKAELEATW